MATSSSSKPPLSPLFTPIEEGNEEDEYSQGRSSSRAESSPSEYKHRPTPLHRRSSKKRPESDENFGGDDDSGGVACNKCRPSNRERISVVPLDNNNNNNNGLNRNSLASPNGIFKSIFSSLVKKSPRLSEDGSSSVGTREEQWKIAVAELSHKLIQATRKRDEAVLEASRLKYSMAELEKKLNKLEIYCHNLKSGLEVCTNNNSQPPPHPPRPQVNFQCVKIGDQERVIEHFLVAVSESRSSIRLLTRSLSLNLKQIGAAKIHERISQLADIKISPSRNSRAALLYLEALLNRAFFEDFESIGFQKSSSNPVLNPLDRCAANFAAFNRLQSLKWEEVLSKGTRFFSEDFSKFCDRKMSEIVAMLSWNRAWPEPLLQAFFAASKAVWLVHLLANSVHPGLPIFRVDNKTRFDPVYMEDKGGDRAKKLVPTMVRIMVTPGFYIYDNVVKCKVLCRYAGNDVVLTPSPT